MIVRPPADDAEREAALLLRWQRLRAPWGQPRGSEVDAAEASAILLVAVDDPGRIIGTGRLHQIDHDTGQIRYMAVATEQSGRGVGRAILASLEDSARRLGLARIKLNARSTVVEFYARQGYRDVGPGPTLYGEISHRLMAKPLPPAAA